MSEFFNHVIGVAVAGYFLSVITNVIIDAVRGALR